MNEPTYISDGFLSLEHGVDGGRPPSVLPDTQVAMAKNTSFRGGYPHQRPTAKKLSYTFDTGLEALFGTAKFQGAGSYVGLDGNAWIWLSLDGRFFRVPISESSSMVEEPDSTIQNSSLRDKAWFCQADKYFLIQDGQGPCLVFDGATLSTMSSIPVGTRMAYGLGRLWVSNGRNYVGGDLIYSDPAKGAASILYFTENDVIAEGGEFSVPKTAGEITGLSFTAKQDAASGEGSLMVFTSNGVFEFDAPVDRTTWQNLQQPIQRFSLLNFGATSHESIVAVNGDLFFRAEDGVRSFYFARRDFGTWGNTPISREVGSILAKDQREWLTYASGVLFDNRVLMTAEPLQTERGVIHRKVVVVDFDLVSGMREKLPPAWEGYWEFPLPVFQVLTVDDSSGRRCILVCLNEDTNAIELWELHREADANQPIESVEWELETKAFQFSQPVNKKRLQSAEFWLDSVKGALTMDAWYKPNQSGCWVPWARYSTTINHCTSALSCTPPSFANPSGRSRVGFGQAPDSMDTTNCEPRRDGYEFQLKLQLNKPATIKRMRVLASIVDENSMPTFTDGCTTLTANCTTC